MAKITREQYNKWNSQAKNGFRFDLEYYLVWGEKTLIKDIKQSDGSIIRFRLWHVAEYETITNKYGYTYNKPTGDKIPTMIIQRLKPCKTEGVYHVLTVKDNTPVGEAENSKKYSTLCKLSGEINTDEELKSIEMSAAE